MKQVLAIFLLLAALITARAAEDFYRDKQGQIYSLGQFGQRIYKDSENDEQTVIDETLNNDVIDFGWKMFQASNSNKKLNFVLSSLSPQILLSYIAKYANGTTKTEIASVTKVKSADTIFKLVNLMLGQETDRELIISNAIFTSQDVKLKKKSKKNSPANVVDLVELDFKNPEMVQQIYSDYVRNKTNGRLSDRKIEITPDTKMILSSTIYFKGDWLFEFENISQGVFNVPTVQGGKLKEEASQNVQPADSTNPLSSQVPVQMMQIKKKFHWGVFKNDSKSGEEYAQWVSVPYNSTESMIIILPNEDKTLDETISAIKKDDISQIVKIISERNSANAVVDLTLPKFRIESALSLVPSLKKMGIREIFTQQANFKPFVHSENVFVSNAVQQSSLEVNEKGSVGASATAFSIAALSITAPLKDAKLVVDRPFIAMILDRKYQVPYFIAKVTDPTKRH